MCGPMKTTMRYTFHVQRSVFDEGGMVQLAVAQWQGDLCLDFCHGKIEANSDVSASKVNLGPS